MPAAIPSAPPQLRRSLTLGDLIVHGLVFIGPVSPFAFYGYVSIDSKGMVALAYLVGAIAMSFTAYSYKLLSADFPLAGSVFAYAKRAIGEKTGFVAGWMLVLDYLLIPAGVYIAVANALHEVAPALPRWTFVVGFIAFGTLINYLGVRINAWVSKLVLVAQLLVLVAFVVLGLVALHRGAGAGHLTLNPLYQPHAVSVGLVFSAVSLASVSFLGFDSIALLAEETEGDSKRLVGKATLASLALTASLFVAQTWIAADLANGMTFASPDTAMYEIAAIAGGKAFSTVTAIVVAITFGLASASVVQASISRLLYAMARERRMPSFMAAVHPRFQTPHKSLLFVAAVSIALALAFLDHFELIGTLVNFGALTGFLILHVTVVFHFIVRRRSRAYVRHLACPAIGFGILAYVLYYMEPYAWELGVAWLVLGIVGYGIFVARSRSASTSISGLA